MFQNQMPRYDILSEDAMAKLDAGWRRLITEIGVEFMDQRALDLFAKAGQKVEDNTVFLDPDFVLEDELRDPALGDTIRQFTAYESVPGEQAVDVTWVYESSSHGDDAPTRVTLRYHYFYPHQYDLLFGLTGFRLLGLLGDYDDSRFDEDSERLIVVGEAE